MTSAAEACAQPRPRQLLLGEKASWPGMFGTTSVLFPSGRTFTSHGGPPVPHQSPSYKHHTQLHYTESVSPTGSRPHPEPSVLGWASLARSRNLGIHHSQVIIT